MITENASYVYHYKDEHVEVKITGRTATKTIPAVGVAKERKDVLYEIQPVELEDGRWKRFVRESDLIVIESEAHRGETGGKVYAHTGSKEIV